MIEAPAPLTSAECDCTDLDGFMLNTERLMASELVALSSHEVVAAALFLWCRAWKQRPAASLPDDDRVNAAFARMPLAKFKKLKDEILRGFVKCSDGRLYHKVLADEAVKAFTRKQAFRRKRETDADRLRRWRLTHGETHPETAVETQDETRVSNAHETTDETRSVREGQGQGQGQGQGHKKERKKDGSPEISEPAAAASPPLVSDSPKDRLWRDGIAAIGALASKPPGEFRGVVGRWLKTSTAEQVLEAIAKAQAEKAIDPVPFIAACLARGRKAIAAGPVIPLDF